jgi:hypothetical protein
VKWHLSIRPQVQEGYPAWKTHIAGAEAIAPVFSVAVVVKSGPGFVSRKGRERHKYNHIDTYTYINTQLEFPTGCYRRRSACCRALEDSSTHDM